MSGFGKALLAFIIAGLLNGEPIEIVFATTARNAQSFPGIENGFATSQNPERPASFGQQGADRDQDPPPPQGSVSPPSVVRKSGGVLQQSATRRVDPTYPPLAKAARVNGAVVVEVTVAEDGTVRFARALSGHPLLKDAAVAAARQWEFTPTTLSGKPVKVIGTLTFNFLPATETPKSEKDDTVWQTNLKLYQEQLKLKSPDPNKLALALAHLAVTAIDSRHFSETLTLFEEAEGRNQMPPEVMPYYALLLSHQYEYDREQAGKNNAEEPATQETSAKGLALFLQSYSDEGLNKTADARLLFDIAVCITKLKRELEPPQEQINWLEKMLAIPGLAEKKRAAINYSLGTQYWQLAYSLSSPYTMNQQAIPPQTIPLLREIIAEGNRRLENSLALAPEYANSWYYKSLLLKEEAKIETNVQKRSQLEKAQIATQNRFLLLNKNQTGASFYESSDEPYASGLPALRISEMLLPPPPPPPPPPLAQRPAPRREQTLALIAAVKQADLARVKTLLAQKEDVNAKDAEGRTALMHAVSLRSAAAPEILQMLLANHADVNARDNDGAMALALAISGGTARTIQLLINNGADVNAQEDDGYTALMYAAEDNKLEIVRLLLAHGANAGIKNRDGATALSLAEEEEHEEIVKILRGRL